MSLNLTLMLLEIRRSFLNAKKCKVFLPVLFPSRLPDLNVQYKRIIKFKNDNPTESATINFSGFIFCITSAGNHNIFLGSQLCIVNRVDNLKRKILNYMVWWTHCKCTVFRQSVIHAWKPTEQSLKPILSLLFHSFRRWLNNKNCKPQLCAISLPA